MLRGWFSQPSQDAELLSERQVMLQPRRDHGNDADASTSGASGNGVIDDVVFLHRAVPGTCRHARSTLALQQSNCSLLSTSTN